MTLWHILYRYRNWLLLLPLWAALYFSGCFGRSWSYNYEMIVTVETPEGPKVGSSVRRVVYTIQPAWLSAQRTNALGEAVVVDLGPRGKLFALLNGPGTDGPWNAENVLPDSMPSSFGIPSDMDRTVIIERLHSKGVPVDVQVKCHVEPNLLGKNNLLIPVPVYGNCPTFVAFGNLSDPKSVFLVSPLDLQAAFGKGVRLSSVRVRLTDRSLTFILEKTLRWLPSYSDRNIFRMSEQESKDAKYILNGTNFQYKGN